MIMHLTRTIARFFPAPRLLMPRAAGVDITDSSVKWITLTPLGDGFQIESFGSETIPAGVVQNGVIKDVQVLGEVLSTVRKRIGTVYAHAALPEEGAYVFSMHVPGEASTVEITNMIEFELEGRVPVPVPDTVYDYDVIEGHQDGSGTEIGVVAFSKDIAAGYAAAFKAGGIELLSLEIEARSIARAVMDPRGTDPITLLVDTGMSRTGFAILKRGIPIFTSTVEVGGAQMTKVVMELLNVDEKEAQVFKNEQGLVVVDQSKAKVTEALTKVATGLADEVSRHYHFWDTRRNEHGERVTPVEMVLLVGGSANLKGITDFIAGKVHARTERPNVWRNVNSFDVYVPPIDRRTSLQYATAIGLALRGQLV